MKLFPFLALSIATLACSSTESVQWTDYGDDPMQNPQYMEDMTAAGTPGPQHESLAKLAGNWTVVGKSWMEPGTDPIPMNATATIETILGGRYVVEEFKSDFMGMPFEGRLVQGFDNLSQQYWSLWTDSASTGYWLSHGTETSPGTIEMFGTARDILTPQGRPVRMTSTTDADGNHVMRMYDTREGGVEFQSMELSYTRD